MSEQKWLTNKGGGWRAESSMNSKVVLTTTQANSLALASYDTSVATLVFGDYSKWCASLIYYPIILNDYNTEYNLRAGGIDYSATVRGFINTANEFGFTLGEYYYPESTSYIDFEPYTKLEIYLPYYGFTPLKIADVQGKYIQFRLYVDYSTGQAQYVVGVNESSVANGAMYPSVGGLDDTNTRILGIYNFQLGVSIPIGSTNFNDTVRNTILGVGKAVSSIGLSFASEFISKGQQTDTSERKIFTTERLNTAISTAGTILGNLNFSTQGITSNNGSLNNNLCPSVAVVISKAIPTLDTESSAYKALNGLPLGECKLLSELTGYTTVSDIRLEGSGFDTATQEEMLELERLIYQGIII